MNSKSLWLRRTTIIIITRTKTRGRSETFSRKYEYISPITPNSLLPPILTQMPDWREVGEPGGAQ